MASHTPESAQSATLDQFSGLVTNVDAENVPEGASPLTWDTDFVVGSVFTRAGLTSVYTFEES